MKRPARSGMKTAGVLLLTLVAVAWAGTRVYNKTLHRPFVKGPVLRVVDGDTVVLSDGRRMRLLGINTPEHGERMADQAKEFVEKFVEKPGVVVKARGKMDYYHRVLGDLIRNGQSLCEALVAHGLAHVMLIPPYDHARAKRLLEAQDRARAKRIGIWKLPRYAHALHITMFKTSRRKKRGGGYLRVANISAGPVDLGQYLLSNGKRMLALPSCVIPKGETVILRAAKGRNRCRPGRKMSVSLGDRGFFGRGKARAIIIKAGPGHQIIDKVRAHGL